MAGGGRAYTSGTDRDRVAAAVDAPVWHAPTEQGPLSPVLTLHAVVTELRRPQVSALAWGGGEANVLDYPDGPATATYVGWSDRGGTGPPVTSPRGGLTDT